MKRSKDFFRGSLLGGAIGDALGWPVEFMSYQSILNKYGIEGITDLIYTNTMKAEVTDDTQMTLFTAEGILRAETRGSHKGICHIPSVVYRSYLRWLVTQGYSVFEDDVLSGELIKEKTLFNKRAPGNTCISALRSKKMGMIDSPLNNSKGCGGVMRVAPVGLFYRKEEAFKIGSEIAAITHSHPSGYLSAGALSYIIASIIEGMELEDAVDDTLLELKKHSSSEECFNALSHAIELSQKDVLPIEAIPLLGEGWVGEEALAISVYCALKYKHDFKKALISSVNHNGDSDSTGAITGNILGAYLGLNGIPKDWIEHIELKDLIIEIADDLLTRYSNTDEWWDKYPGF